MHVGDALAASVADRYDGLLREGGSGGTVMRLDHIDRRFSDSETCVRLASHVGGSDAFIFQSLFDPTSDSEHNQNYMAFLIAARALREHGAAYVTACCRISRTRGRTSRRSSPARPPAPASWLTSARSRPAWTTSSHGTRTCDRIRGFYGAVPVDALESLTLFIDEFGRFKGREDVIAVAPDAGASKFVTHFGRALGIKCAIASKYRPRPEEVVISEIIGDFAGKTTAIVLDDMISNAGTVNALVRKLAEEKGIRDVYLGSWQAYVGKACRAHARPQRALQPARGGRHQQHPADRRGLRDAVRQGPLPLGPAGADD